MLVMKRFRIIRCFVVIVLMLWAGLEATKICAQAIPAPRLIPASASLSGLQEDDSQAMTDEAMVIEQQVEMPDAAPATATPGTASSDAQREQIKQALLKKLDTIILDRLPSKILETWSSEKQPAKEDANADLPPAPKDAFLYDNVRFDLKLKQLQSDFALGSWGKIDAVLKLLPEANAKKLHRKIVSSLNPALARKLADNAVAGQQADPRAYQKPFLTFEDIISIVDISPATIDRKEIPTYAVLLREAINQGNSVQDLVSILKDKIASVEAELEKKQSQLPLKENTAAAASDDSSKPEKNGAKSIESFFTQRNCARLLMSAGLTIEAGEFLPELETAQRENDHEALNLLSRYYLAQYARDQETPQLEKAWDVTQAILTAEGVDKDERKQALTRAVDLSTKVRKELGQKWLDDTFSKESNRGIELLAGIGADVSRSMLTLGNSPEARLAQLKLQENAIQALMERNTEISGEWKNAVELMAFNWLREAVVAYEIGDSSSIGPLMQRDMYGNIFYSDDYYQRQQQMARRLTPINVSDLLDVKPSEAWLEQVNPTLRPKFDMILTQLYLKVQEEGLALPYLEKLAEPYPEQTEALVKEFLRVWTDNHDPNSSRRRTDYYMYMYAYESRAESIPLTRSKQQRNLKELSELIPKLQKLQKKELDQDLIAKAFFTCHSTAEVYRIEEIEQIFGNFEQIKPEVIMSIAQQMRSNLAKNWRDATVQKNAKTKRSNKEIEEEVLRGYAVAQAVLDRGIAEHPDAWSLMVANASLKHDENNYRADLAKSSEFSPRRIEALNMFRAAAEKYVEKVAELEEKDYSTEAFTTWFYAGLGACDLGLIDETRLNAPNEPAKIKQVLESMPEKQREWHVSRFANLLFNRMSAAKPQLKHRYLKAGFEIVGDNKQAYEAKKVFDYYSDLVSEIKLETRVDGDDRVGTQQPFGVYVNLTHTREIERESGGFGRYLQNQNSSRSFSYNYGRPTEDYRDKFEEYIRQTFGEQFEIMSVTFQNPEVKSVPARKEGWRITPYAYLLLKSRGAHVDKLPPVKLDLDFLDTSGYAILPIESPALPIDCREHVGRPANDIKVTQILDERQSADGKLILEVKATARGLVPDLAEILSLDANEFAIDEVADQGLSVAKFDDNANENVVLSERTWLVSYSAKSGQTQLPKSFAFPKPIMDTQEMVYQRYVDADLAMVPSMVELEEKYGQVSYARLIFAGLISLGILVLAFLGFWIFSSPSKVRRRKSFELGDDASPFAVISMLQEIHQNNGLNDRQKRDLRESINRLEKYYFSMDASHNGNEPDLQSEFRKWSRQAKL